MATMTHRMGMTIFGIYILYTYITTNEQTNNILLSVTYY